LTPQLTYVLATFMSAAAHLPDPTPDPDQPRAAKPVPAAIGRVLGVLRKLIDYGKHLAATVQQRAAAPDFAHLARPFGTADIATILARITNGLCRAMALEARLIQRADRGQDLSPPPLPAARAPRPARQVAPPDPQPAEPTQHPDLARLPTEAEIAAEVRRRPIGAVIADICHDLGIAPGRLDRAFWDELSHVIIAHGGSLVRFVTTLHKRMSDFVLANLANHLGQAALPHPAPPTRQPALATGPP
jgi:hypothetical protein